MIEIRNVSLSIGGKSLLNRINLTCQPGTVTALVGPNGAGKSTLLSVIAGDYAPDTGEVLLNGGVLRDFSIRELAQIRSVFPQGSAIRFGYQVHEVVAMGRTFRNLPPGDDDSAIDHAMDRTEIAHMAWRDAQTLSGGEQARTTFARVLVQDCPIVLLDEPTAALDLRHQERVLAAATDLARQGGYGACCAARPEPGRCPCRTDRPHAKHSYRRDRYALGCPDRRADRKGLSAGSLCHVPPASRLPGHPYALRQPRGPDGPPDRESEQVSTHKQLRNLRCRF